MDYLKIALSEMTATQLREFVRRADLKKKIKGFSTMKQQELMKKIIENTRVEEVKETKVIEEEIKSDSGMGEKDKKVKVIQEKMYNLLGGADSLENLKKSMKGSIHDALVMDLGKKINKRNLNKNVRVKPISDIDYSKEVSVFPWMDNKLIKIKGN